MKKIIFNGVDDFVVSRAANIVEENGILRISKKFVGEYVGYKFFVKIRSEEQEEVDFMYDVFGGYRGEQIKDGKTYYWFNVQDGRAIMLLELLYDELETERELIDLMIKLHKIIARGTRQKLSDEQKQERLDIYNQIKKKYRRSWSESNNLSVLNDQDTTRTLD